MRARSAANSADSSPPSPDFTSSTTSSASCGSRGASRSVSWVFEFGDARGSSSGTSAAKDASSVGELPGGLEITARRLQLAVGGDDRRQLREPTPDPAGRAGVGVQGRVGELTFEVGVLGEERVDPACRYRWQPSCLSLERSAGNANRRPSLSTDATERAPMDELVVGSEPFSSARCACRSASRSGPRGRRCRGSSACRCRTGGTGSRPRPRCGRSPWCCASGRCFRSRRPRWSRRSWGEYPISCWSSSIVGRRVA